MEDGLSQRRIEDEGWRVSLDPRLEQLPTGRLIEIIERQANAIRILQRKARQRAELTEELLERSE